MIVGNDPKAAAWVALGIAQVQSRRRRVAICDLVGDVPPLQSLVKTDDPHGIVDSFQYGISLNKIAYQVDASGNLFIMPSGTEPVVDESIIRSDRWRRLSGGFREVGALLLLVARVDAPGLSELVGTTDGLVVIGEVSPAGVGPVIASTRLLGPRRPTPRPHRRSVPRKSKRPGWLLPMGAAVVALLAAVLWWVLRDTPADVAGVIPTAAADSVASNDSAPSLAPPELVGDSAAASAFAVEIVKLNTQSGAILKLHDQVGKLPAVTYSPVILGAEAARWFTVVTGAFPVRSSADSMLTVLRERRVLDDDVGNVVRLPYALVLQWDVSRETAAAVVRAYIARELPAYALLQDDGSARIYAGAFETPDQAALLAASVRAAGIEPTVAYRMGRTF